MRQMASDVRPNLYAFSDEAALRATRRIFLSARPVLAILTGVGILVSWRRSSQRPLFTRLLRLATPVFVPAATAASGFGVMKYYLASRTYSCSPEAFTAAGVTILRSTSPRLDIQPTYFTLHPAHGPAVRVLAELDNYPELLASLRAWNLPQVTTRDTSLRRLAISYSFTLAGVAAMFLLFYR
jgi:hypothetical protein